MSKQTNESVQVFLRKVTVTSGRGGFPSIGYAAELVNPDTGNVLAKTKSVDGVHKGAWIEAGTRLAIRRGYRIVRNPALCYACDERATGTCLIVGDKSTSPACERHRDNKPEPIKPSYTWTVEITIAPVWVADGANLTSEGMHDIMCRAFSWAMSHEIACKVIKAPSDESIAAEQGFKSVAEFRHVNGGKR